MQAERLDVIIVGGGPAGLSAALVLGRARRRVALFDDGRPRNAVSRASHGFLSRDGIAPDELLRISREQLVPYANVQLQQSKVIDARRDGDGFEVVTDSGLRARSRKLILATGMVDRLPAVKGLQELYGRGVYSCPYCDGWEVRDQCLAVYGQSDERGGEFALELTVWSRDVVLCTDGSSRLSRECLARLERNGIRVMHERIEHLSQEGGMLSAIVFEDAAPLRCGALFVCSDCREASDLAKRVGSERWTTTDVHVQRHGRAGVPGLFVIGDASRDVLQVAVAVGEGSEAAITVNCELLREDLR